MIIEKFQLLEVSITPKGHAIGGKIIKPASMIKANELRIGNLVEYNDDAVIFQVTEVSKTGIGVKNANEETWIELDQFSPIPLTPEILKSAGFELSNTMLDYEKGIVSVRQKENGYEIGWYYSTIYYLHQLQNLYFALTGQELTINLHATV